MPTRDEQFWHVFFSKRQLDEIMFDRAYFDHMREPFSPHDMRMMIAKMAELLDVFGPQDTATFTTKMKEMRNAQEDAQHAHES